VTQLVLILHAAAYPAPTVDPAVVVDPAAVAYPTTDPAPIAGPALAASTLETSRLCFRI
jgi:hypothetical protein